MLLNFNVSEFVPEQKTFEAIPEGTIVRVMIEGEDTKVSGPNSASPNTEYVVFKLRVIDGPYKNKVIFENLYLNHSGQAQRIAREALFNIATATGKDPAKLKATSELHNRPFSVCVKVEKSEGYADKNKVKYYVTGPVKAVAAAPAATKAPEPVATEIDDDDFPFN
ncbi:MAG: DUF669 domain-containing protein [Hahellaceae bacterium]|nr:DUF669 domain-containing protein [Hahellaceae bacterium]